MSVKLTINEHTFSVSKDTACNSEYIKGLLDDFGDDGIIIDVPEKYNKVIHNYIYFLRSKPFVIVDRHVLSSCFDLSTYFCDNTYFNYLVKQLLNHWSHLFMVVYENVNPDLQRQILLHCPHDFLPDKYINNGRFLLQWVTTFATDCQGQSQGQSQVVKVNNSMEYEIKVEDDMKCGDNSGIFTVILTRCDKSVIMKNYCCDRGKESFLRSDGVMLYHVCGRKTGLTHPIFVKTLTISKTDGTILSEKSEDNGQLEGVSRKWFDTGVIRSEIEMQRGKCCGLERKYYTSGSAKNSGINYENRKNGPWTRWYDDNDHGKQMLKTKTSYSQGGKHGKTKKWTKEGKLSEYVVYDYESSSDYSD